jgi:prefoldin subunit 5
VANILAKTRKTLIRTFFSSSFNRDIVILMIFSIGIGSALASLVAMSANTYFSETISTLVGNFGEYDLLINVREDMKQNGQEQIEKVIEQAFPGGKLKEGPTLNGLTSFLVGLPPQYKTKQTYETIDNIFGSVPGRSGISIMTEPRVTVKAVADGAKSTVIEQIMHIDGVLFAFRDGGSVTVIIQSLDKSPYVNTEVEKLLDQYHTIDIAFPVGSEPENPIRLGEQIADAIREEKAAGYAESVSVDSKSNDMAYMVSTMLELKRFLTAYATKAVITPAAGVTLRMGDIIVFQGTAPKAPASGAPVDAANVLVKVTAVKSDHSAEGMVIQGDGTQVANNQGYGIINTVIGDPVGTATFQNPRKALADALAQTSNLVNQIPKATQDAQNISGIANSALNSYSGSITAVEQTLSSLASAGTTIQAATSGLSNLDSSAIQLQLKNSSQAMGSLANTLQIVRLVNPDVSSSINELTATQQNLTNLQNTLSALDNVAADARRARSAIDNIVVNGNSMVANLRAFDVNGAHQSLNDAGTSIAQLQQFNTPLVAAQLQYLGTAVPNLKDEEISRSINLMDQFIAGQVIPSQSIQILTKSNITTEFATPIISRVVGNNNFSLYSSVVGVIEPDPRAQVMTILMQVKAILAGMVSLIATILFLTLDHTAIMTVIRRRRTVNKTPRAKGWRRLLHGIKNTFTAPECIYGMGIGALNLTAMFILSKGGIPNLPWIGVPFLGAAIGLLLANNSEKISPISVDEVTAGEALGLSFDEVMREIVIPDGRPGLLQTLNRRKMKFK